MKCINLISTIAAGILLSSALHANELVLPMDAINTLKTCDIQSYEGYDGPSIHGNMSLSKVWFEQMNIAFQTNDLQKMTYLVKRRTLHTNYSNLLDLKNDYQNQECRNAVNVLIVTFKHWSNQANTILKDIS